VTLGELLPWLTGAGGALVALSLGHWLVLTGRYVTGREMARVLEANSKLEAANDALRDTVATLSSQNDRLLDSSRLSNSLAGALVSVVQQPRPGPPEIPAKGAT